MQIDEGGGVMVKQVGTDIVVTGFGSDVRDVVVRLMRIRRCTLMARSRGRVAFCRASEGSIASGLGHAPSFLRGCAIVVSEIGVGSSGGIRVSDAGLDTGSGHIGGSNSGGFGGRRWEFAGHGAACREHAQGAVLWARRRRVRKKKN